MTEPKLETCPGSGQKKLGDDEPGRGMVSCGVCGNSGLPMKIITTADGTEVFSVPPHKRRVNLPRPKGRRRAVQPSRRGRRRESGRR
jgi:hypothetical protein